MKGDRKRFYIYNAIEGGPVYGRPLPVVEALGLIRFVRQILEQKSVYVSKRGRRIRPEELVFVLIDADSDEGRRLASQILAERQLRAKPTKESSREQPEETVMGGKAESLTELIKWLVSPEPVLMTGTGVMQIPRRTGIVHETNEETYDHFLDALPVRYMRGSLFCFADGCNPLTLFFRRQGRHFVRPMSEDETDAFCLLADIPRLGYG